MFWRMLVYPWDFLLGQIMRSRLFEHFTKMSPAFYQTYRTGTWWHATNDINALTRRRWRCHVCSGCLNHSFSDLVDHALWHFLADDSGCYFAPAAPGLCHQSSREKDPQGFGESQAAFSELKVQGLYQVLSDQVFRLSGGRIEVLSEEVNELSKEPQTMKYDSLFDLWFLLFVSFLLCVNALGRLHDGSRKRLELQLGI